MYHPRQKVLLAWDFTNHLMSRTVGIILWRLINTIKTRYDKDFIWNLYVLGLIGFLELWLGIIVACIPTLAPLFNHYVKPKISRVTGNSSTGDRIDANRRDVRTIGASSASRNRNRVYSQLEEDGSFNNSDELKLVREGNIQMETHCSAERKDNWSRDSVPATMPMNGIHVQREFHHQRQ